MVRSPGAPQPHGFCTSTPSRRHPSGSAPCGCWLADGRGAPPTAETRSKEPCKGQGAVGRAAAPGRAAPGRTEAPATAAAAARRQQSRPRAGGQPAQPPPGTSAPRGDGADSPVHPPAKPREPTLSWEMPSHRNRQQAASPSPASSPHQEKASVTKAQPKEKATTAATSLSGTFKLSKKKASSLRDAGCCSPASLAG